MKWKICLVFCLALFPYIELILRGDSVILPEKQSIKKETEEIYCFLFEMEQICVYEVINE